MKISELEEFLYQIRKKHGDVKVLAVSPVGRLYDFELENHMSLIEDGCSSPWVEVYVE